MPVEIVDASGKRVQLKVRECSRRLIMTGSSRSQKNSYVGYYLDEMSSTAARAL
jgi:hypothetical protein